MTASELHRKLLYCGYSDVTDYLRNSPLNRYIYKRLLDLLPTHQIDVPIITIFNEVYYLCVSVRFDSKPGVDIGRRYFPCVEANLGNCRPAAQLVFCLVWVLFQLKKGLTFHEECFVEQLTPYIKNNDFYEEGRNILEALQIIGVEAPDEFPTMTCKIDELCRYYKVANVSSIVLKLMISGFFPTEKKFESYADAKAWAEVTNNYSQSVIESYVGLFTKLTDRMILLECIYWSCSDAPKKVKDRVAPFILNLQDKISKEIDNQNDFENASIFLSEYKGMDKNDVAESEISVTKEQYEYEHPELEDDYEETIEQKAKRLENECHRLRREKENQKKDYEERITKLESSLQREINDLTARLQTLESGVNPDAEQQEPSFYLSEMVDYAKEHFGESVGKEVSAMLMRLTFNHRNFEETNFQLIDSIEKAIKEKNRFLQTIDITTAHQVYVSPQNVNNITKEKKQ